MQLSIKTKGIIVTVIFMVIMLLPVCYAAYKEYQLKHAKMKQPVPQAMQQ